MTEWKPQNMRCDLQGGVKAGQISHGNKLAQCDRLRPVAQTQLDNMTGPEQASGQAQLVIMLCFSTLARTECGILKEQGPHGNHCH